MRRLLTFPCGDEMLAGSLDEAGGSTGILLVTGGTQTRVGSHRMYEQLAKYLAEHGFPCLRYDRRGVGDSSGEDPDFRDSLLDLCAAVEAFHAHRPGLERVYGFGLCDGATALALHGLEARVDGVILTNPWLVETDACVPAPAAIRSHYRKQLTSLAGWKKLLGGGVNLGKLLKGLRRASAREDRSLADDAAFGLTLGMYNVAVILARDDNTAIAAAAEMKRPSFQGLINWSIEIDSDSHTFARTGDQEALNHAVLKAVRALQA